MSASGIVEEADFVIVGSGAAGATCARILAAAGHEVVIVEEGPLARPARGDALQALEGLYRDGGAIAAIGPDPLPILQGRCVGGTTVVNGAIQVPFPEAVWREWVERDRRWAVRLPWADLEAARNRIDQELLVRPTPPELRGGDGRAMAATAAPWRLLRASRRHRPGAMRPVAGGLAVASRAVRTAARQARMSR